MRFLMTINGAVALQGDTAEELFSFATAYHFDNPEAIIQIYDKKDGSPGREIFHTFKAENKASEWEEFVTEFNSWYDKHFS